LGCQYPPLAASCSQCIREILALAIISKCQWEIASIPMIVGYFYKKGCSQELPNVIGSIAEGRRKKPDVRRQTQ